MRQGVGRTYLTKGVIEIIFHSQISQICQRYEDDSSSATSWIYTYPIFGLRYYLMVWAIVLSVPKAMREPENEIRQYVPTPFYFITAYRREQVSRISQQI